MEHVDVLIVGAGLSGVSAAWHLQTECPELTYLVIEARERMGGTWDLFRYPGIRSDSDMFTLGYRFQPWREAKAIADGPSIKAYIESTAREHGIDRRIWFQHRLIAARWSSETARWTVDVDVGAERVVRQISCRFIHSCTGYYDYAQGYTPSLPGIERFGGRVVHPQHWPEVLEYAGQRVVVIGSGATAVTLVPAMSAGAGAAAHVTMLQRSPSYVATLPSRDPVAEGLRRMLPTRLAYALIRWKNVARSMFYFWLARTKPEAFKRGLRANVRAALGPEYPVDVHFKPHYQPWDQRLCIVPDGDLFAAIREGRASVVTDRIRTIDERGVQLESGGRLDADILVTATGLRMSILTGVQLEVDGHAVVLADGMVYKGMMLSDLPNFFMTVGYTNASWTLKADLVAQHVCRLLRYMRTRRFTTVTPRRDPAMPRTSVFDFTSGYVQRAEPSLPKQGTAAPWRLYQNYVKDLLMLRHGRVDDPALEFRA